MRGSSLMCIWLLCHAAIALTTAAAADNPGKGRNSNTAQGKHQEHASEYGPTYGYKAPPHYDDSTDDRDWFQGGGYDGYEGYGRYPHGSYARHAHNDDKHVRFVNPPPVIVQACSAQTFDKPYVYVQTTSATAIDATITSECRGENGYTGTATLKCNSNGVFSYVSGCERSIVQADKTFIFVATPKSQPDARTDCTARSVGGGESDLATIEETSDIAVLQGELSAFPGSSSWIGLVSGDGATDELEDFYWLLTNNRPSNNRWAPNAPKNRGAFVYEDSTSLWHDASGVEQLFYICQVPTPIIYDCPSTSIATSYVLTSTPGLNEGETYLAECRSDNSAGYSGTATLTCRANTIVYSGGCDRVFGVDSKTLKFVSSQRLAYSDARTACLNWGGDLVSIETEAEHSALKTELQNINGNAAWIGLHADQATTDASAFKWYTTGAAPTTTWWASFEPSGDGACVEQRPDTLSTWNDYLCEGENYYMCEATTKKRA